DAAGHALLAHLGALDGAPVAEARALLAEPDALLHLLRNVLRSHASSSRVGRATGADGWKRMGLRRSAKSHRLELVPERRLARLVGPVGDEDLLARDVRHHLSD